MIRGMGTRALANIGVIALTLFLALWAQVTWAQLSDAPTNVTCEAGQSLWIYELGTRGAAPAPDPKATVSSTSSLEVWSLAGQSMTTARLSGFPEDVVSGQLYERFTPKPESPPIQIGDFAVTWPHGDMIGAMKTGSMTPVASAAAVGNVSPIDISSVYAGDENEDLLNFLKDEVHEGGLTYFINAGAQLEYLRLALCSSAASPNVSVEAGPEEPAPLDFVPVPRVKPESETTVNTGGGETGGAGKSSTGTEGGEKDSSKGENNRGGPGGEGSSINWLGALAGLLGLAAIGLIVAVKGGVLGEKSAPLNVPSAPNAQASNAANAVGVLTGAALAAQTVTLYRPQSPRLNQSERKKSDLSGGGLETGLLFADSPMHPMRPALVTAPAAGAAPVAPPAPPLVTAGQLSPSSLQTLTGAYEVLRPSYQAVGRLGPAQEGVPTSSDFALGTGFLITPRHVMTNRHVYRQWGHYLTGEGCDGIEFLAELGNAESDYHPFDGNPPQLWDGLDIAVFTLADPVRHRTPLPFVHLETETLDGREIVIFGYPDTLKGKEAREEAFGHLVEDDAIFAVKRASQGHIFRHSSDEDVPYGVTTYLSLDKQTKIDMQAICHNASAMTGNSGSPVLDAKTGALLGVHFAGKPEFAGGEDTNLAMAISQIKAQEAQYILSDLA